MEMLAARRGLSVVPSAAAVQLPRARATLRHLLPDAGTPYLAVRIGPRTPGTEPSGAEPSGQDRHNW
jgi:hypothetical protein